MSEPIHDDIQKTVIAICHQWQAMRDAGQDHHDLAQLIGYAILAERRRWSPTDPSQDLVRLLSAATTCTILPFEKSGLDK
jgi:hypothetical protein